MSTHYSMPTIKVGQTYLERSTMHIFDTILLATEKESGNKVVVYRNHTGTFTLPIETFVDLFDPI